MWDLNKSPLLFDRGMSHYKTTKSQQLLKVNDLIVERPLALNTDHMICSAGVTLYYVFLKILNF